MFQCPCCDYFTLETCGKSDICEVCYWEDDGNSLETLDEYSRSNGMTLRHGRKNFLELGACEHEMLQYVLKPEERLNFQRSPRSL